MKEARAKLIWCDEKRIPPVLPVDKRKKSCSYAPIIVFENQYDKPIWNHNVSTVPLWSAVIFNEKIAGKESIATITYLSPKAPFEFMKIGVKFDLFEGAHCVAQGIILEELK